MVRVLFVCSGNICRSPTAEGVMRKLLAERGLEHRVEVDSAGTHGFHEGEAPDTRSQAQARRRGIELGDQRARQVRREDFHDFDLIVAMDRGHLRELERMAPPDAPARVELFLRYAPECGQDDVPDPYYGAGDGFETVLDLVEAGARGLLAAFERDGLLDAKSAP
ncbi:MAG: low molecular weight protein-tyrosine-phosphatase [Alphaproteobacteria bacterium]